jgi:hypothetical protein
MSFLMDWRGERGHRCDAAASIDHRTKVPNLCDLQRPQITHFGPAHLQTSRLLLIQPSISSCNKLSPSKSSTLLLFTTNTQSQERRGTSRSRSEAVRSQRGLDAQVYIRGAQTRAHRHPLGASSPYCACLRHATHRNSRITK